MRGNFSEIDYHSDKLAFGWILSSSVKELMLNVMNNRLDPHSLVASIRMLDEFLKPYWDQIYVGKRAQLLQTYNLKLMKLKQGQDSVSLDINYGMSWFGQIMMLIDRGNMAITQTGMDLYMEPEEREEMIARGDLLKVRS